MQGAVNDPGRVASGVLALAVHLLFFALLVFGISWQKKVTLPVLVDLWEELPPPPRVEAPKVEPAPAPPQPQPKVAPPPPKVETPPQPSRAEIELREKQRKEREEQARLLEEQRRLEAERLRLEQEERKRVEAEKRRLEEEARRRDDAMRLAEELRKEEEVARKEQFRREEETKRREEEAKRRQEEERARAAAQEEQRRRDELARRQREAEEARQRADADARAARDRVVADYVARIRAKIQSRVVIPPGLQGNPQAVYEVTLLPGGDVLQAVLRRSSGVGAYDEAVERAIMAAQPLPVPTDPNLFQSSFRVLELKFKPKE